MEKNKGTKKKKGCLGLFFNFLLLLMCLAVTGLLFYFAALVVMGNPDPVEEMKKLPGQLRVLPEKIKGLLDKSKSNEEARESKDPLDHV